MMNNVTNNLSSTLTTAAANGSTSAYSNAVLGDFAGLNQQDLQFMQAMNKLHFDKKVIDADNWQ
jgi:hypothetical protein